MSHILLVDDDADILGLLSGFFRKHGHVVTTATGGAAMFEALEKQASDLVILDAQKVDAGPVAVIKLPTRVRSTFHGMFVPEDALKTGRYTMSLAG